MIMADGYTRGSMKRTEAIVGTAVRLFIGGPKMIIAELDPAPGTHAQCVWFDDDDRRQQGWFEIAWLRSLDIENDQRDEAEEAEDEGEDEA